MKFYEQRFAEEYDRRLREENYPGELFEEVISELSAGSSILDCGAGSGLFTIPLVLSGYSVIAVEPSLAMIDILKRKVFDKKNFPIENLNKLEIINATWEEYEGTKASFCICIHALYGMQHPETAIVKMKEYADKVIILINDHARKSNTLAEKIRMSLPGERSYRRNSIDLGAILGHQGIPFSCRKIHQKRFSRFIDLDEETDYYRYHLKLSEKYSNEIKKIIQNNSVRSDYYFEAELDYYDEIFIF